MLAGVSGLSCNLVQACTTCVFHQPKQPQPNVAKHALQQFQSVQDVTSTPSGVPTCQTATGCQTEEEEFVATCSCSLGQRYNTLAEELPEEMSSSGIEGSYRPVSCARCAALSVLGVHNETVNIWTHIFGVLMLLLHYRPDTPPNLLRIKFLAPWQFWALR